MKNAIDDPTQNSSPHPSSTSAQQMSEEPASNYVLGRTDHERRRLFLQGSILNPLTEEFLQNAGLSAGMRVLDLGCGIGDVALIAAGIVGDSGSVTALDIDDKALHVARMRAGDAGLRCLSFQQADVAQYRPGRLFDAVVGRHILIHSRDALALMRAAVTFVPSGGIVAFQEYDLSSWQPGYPALPLTNTLQELMVGLFRRATPHANIGMRLYYLMREAGLSEPQARAECLIGAGPDSPFYEWLAETIRSLLPGMKSLGLVTENEVDPDTLTDRLRDEIVSASGCLPSPMIVSAFARKL